MDEELGSCKVFQVTGKRQKPLFSVSRKNRTEVLIAKEQKANSKKKRPRNQVNINKEKMQVETGNKDKERQPNVVSHVQLKAGETESGYCDLKVIRCKDKHQSVQGVPDSDASSREAHRQGSQCVCCLACLHITLEGVQNLSSFPVNTNTEPLS